MGNFKKDTNTKIWKPVVHFKALTKSRLKISQFHHVLITSTEKSPGALRNGERSSSQFGSTDQRLETMMSSLR